MKFNQLVCNQVLHILILHAHVLHILILSAQVLHILILSKQLFHTLILRLQDLNILILKIQVFHILILRLQVFNFLILRQVCNFLIWTIVVFHILTLSRQFNIWIFWHTIIHLHKSIILMCLFNPTGWHFRLTGVVSLVALWLHCMHYCGLFSVKFTQRCP